LATSTITGTQYSKALRNLFFTRTIVQFVWAGLILIEAVDHLSLAAVLLLLYPFWDVACTIFDVKTAARSISGAPTAQYVNVALGVMAAIGIAVTVFKSPAQAIVVFGAWALAAGLAQLAVGLSRRKQMGGQWAMILSGLQSTAAGFILILGGLHGTKHIHDIGRYAILGAVYFLIAGMLLHRKLSRPLAIQTMPGVEG
jgi:hypothetical protein